MTAADKTTVIIIGAVLAFTAALVYIACDASSYDTQAMEVRDGRKYTSGSVFTLPLNDYPGNGWRNNPLLVLRTCAPPRGLVCQPPPRGPRQAARRQFNHDGNGWAWSRWRCLAERESHWNPRVTGAAGERGLFQIHPIWFGRFDEDRLYDPAYNAYAAGVILHVQGWSAWAGAPGCGF